MFKDVGKNIMTWAKVLWWIYLIAGIILFLVYGPIEEEWGIAFACLAGGFGFIVSAWFLYGFGQLVDDIHSIERSTRQTAVSDNVEGSAYEDLPEL